MKWNRLILSPLNITEQKVGKMCVCVCFNFSTTGNIFLKTLLTWKQRLKLDDTTRLFSVNFIAPLSTAWRRLFLPRKRLFVLFAGACPLPGFQSDVDVNVSVCRVPVGANRGRRLPRFWGRRRPTAGRVNVAEDDVPRCCSVLTSPCRLPCRAERPPVPVIDWKQPLCWAHVLLFNVPMCLCLFSFVFFFFV